eukprot:355526-Chlamydomonas_euryale.AAC.3
MPQPGHPACTIRPAVCKIVNCFLAQPRHHHTFATPSPHRRFLPFSGVSPPRFCHTFATLSVASLRRLAATPSPHLGASPHHAHSKCPPSTGTA